MRVWSITRPAVTVGEPRLIKLLVLLTEHQAHERREWKWSQVRTAMRDPQTYFIFFGMLMASMPGGGLNAFANLIWVSFGFDSLQTILLGKIPQDALLIVIVLAIGWFMKYDGYRRKSPQYTRSFVLS